MNKLLVAMTAILLLSACSPKPDNKAEQTTAQSSPDNPSTTADDQIANNEPAVAEFDPENTLQVELIALLQTLDTIAQDAEKKQIEIEEKMQTVTSKEDDDTISKMTIDLLKEQQLGLEEVPLTEEKLIAIRNKLLESTKLGIEANQDMMSIHSPTAEEEQAIVTKFANAQEKSDSAKDELMEMVKELGMDSN